MKRTKSASVDGHWRLTFITISGPHREKREEVSGQENMFDWHMALIFYKIIDQKNPK
jgi:hypothetical protein